MGGAALGLVWRVLQLDLGYQALEVWDHKCRLCSGDPRNGAGYSGTGFGELEMGGEPASQTRLDTLELGLGQS